MARSSFFKFRLGDAERAKLDRRAAEKGLSLSDLIREALDLELSQRPATSTSKALAEAPPSKREADPESEPGKAAIETLAQKIRERDKGKK